MTEPASSESPETAVPPPVASASTCEHRAQGPKSVVCAILTLSDTRTEADDHSGRLIRESLETHGHSVAFYRVLKDDPDAIRAALDEAIATPGVRAILIDGGTGIAGRDNAPEIVEAMLDKRLPGFGEIFRMLSFQEIGAAAMLSRATAGIRGGTAIFSMPGSVHAVRLAIDRLIVPELGHVIREIDKDRAKS